MSKKIIDFFESHGFRHEGTGGNCTAWVRDGFDNQQTVVTDGDGTAPATSDCPARVSVMVDGEESTFTEYATTQELIEKVVANFTGYIL